MNFDLKSLINCEGVDSTDTLGLELSDALQDLSDVEISHWSSFDTLRALVQHVSMSYSSHVSALTSMLPTSQLPIAEAIESHVLIPSLIESIARVQTAGLGSVPNAASFLASQILHEMQGRGSVTIPFGNDEIDNYIESLLVLQHAQRLEMERIIRLVDDYANTYSNRVRSLQVITQSQASANPDVVSSGRKDTSGLPFTVTSSPSASSRAARVLATVPASVLSASSSATDPAAAQMQAQSRPDEVERFISRVAEENRLKRRRSNLPRATTHTLRQWILDYKDHPYPTDVQKEILCEMTGLTLTQLNNWFINNRRRLLNNGRR